MIFLGLVIISSKSISIFFLSCVYLIILYSYFLNNLKDLNKENLSLFLKDSAISISFLFKIIYLTSIFSSPKIWIYKGKRRHILGSLRAKTFENLNSSEIIFFNFFL